MSKNAEGWIRHRGGKCPVEAGVKVDYRMRDGEIDCFGHDAGRLQWSHEPDDCDIMAYRLHKPAEQVADDIYAADDSVSTERVAVSYIGESVQGPLQWRDRITTIDFDIHSLTTERADLVQKLASEGFALIGRINDLLTEAAQKHKAQQPDHGKWEVGDSVECISSNYSFITVGTVYVITGFDRNMVQFLDDDGTEMEYERAHFKFHSRPSD